MSPETADTIRHAADVVQWINLAVVQLLLGVSLEFGRRWPKARPYLAVPVSVGVHSVAFYVTVLFWRLPGPVVSLWSALLRLHIYLVILALLVAAIAVMLSPTPPDGYFSYGNEADE